MPDTHRQENESSAGPSPNIAAPLAETPPDLNSTGAISMGHNRMNRRSPAITYPEPIEFTSFEEFIDRIEYAIGALEGAGVDFVTSDPLEFLKLIDPETGPADLRWLGDLIDRNYERFKEEIAAREPDDGVDFLDPTMPTPEPDFVDMTPADEAIIKDAA